MSRRYQYQVRKLGSSSRVIPQVRVKRGHVAARLFAKFPQSLSQWTAQSLKPPPGLGVLSSDQFNDRTSQRQADQDVQSTQ